jgi:serine/threonine protein kinase
MEAVLILLVIFGSITAWVLGPRFLRIWHEQRMRELDAGGGEQRKALAAMRAERDALEERLRNIETIVCGVDLELNAKLNRLASRQLALAAHVPSAELVRGETSLPASNDPASSPTLMLPKLEPGARIGARFTIERHLGTGGMGAVYLAKDETLGEPVALKLVREAGLGDAHVADRFKREAAAARRIAHPNVVRLHDIGEERGMIYLSMEYVAGESLRETFRRLGALPPAKVRDTISQICAGLGAAHAAGVVHRDLKPENVLIGPSGQIKLIDFGIAKLSDLENMTATRVIMGTPHYMAPEQVRGRPVDARTDLYALGVIAYEALSGKPPYDGETPISISFAHCNETLPPLRSRQPGASEAWEQWVGRALEKDPSRRWSSASEMAAALPAG